MKLATFEHDGREEWGFVAPHPQHAGQAWVFSPARLSRCMAQCCTPTSVLWITPRAFPENWPEDLAGFLAREESGMADLAGMSAFLIAALEQGMDQLMLSEAGFPLSAIRLKAPIPRPRLCFGLVQNGPAFIRNNPRRDSCNLFPQGHNRPQGTVIGPGETVVLTGRQLDYWSYNGELAAVIGKKGKHVPARKAMEHVAGFMPLNDVACNAFYAPALGRAHQYDMPADADWFQDATLSWGGKMADTLCPMGPFLVTRDEVPNPYDLLAYTRQNGLMRDRASTGCYLLGIERIIDWYTSFATLYPGDIIHLGTMAVDGLGRSSSHRCGPGERIEIEIERLGSLRNKAVLPEIHEWRDQQDSSLSLHPSPAVRDLVKNGTDTLSEARDWHPRKARHYWTVYANYRDVEAMEGLRVSSFPRFLNTPATSLAPAGCRIDIPPRATTLHFGIELACVIGRTATRVGKEDAGDYILGYTPLLSVSDQSFADGIVQPATPQEKGLPVVYGRWADDFNVVLAQPLLPKDNLLYDLDMQIMAGTRSASGSSSEYVLGFADVLAFISSHITLFPGDVLTLGRIASRLSVPAGEAVKEGTALKGTIAGLPPVEASLQKRTFHAPRAAATAFTVHAPLD